LLGTWRGVLVTDRHGYLPLVAGCRRRFCWAHLKRDIQAIVEREGDSGTNRHGDAQARVEAHVHLVASGSRWHAGALFPRLHADRPKALPEHCSRKARRAHAKTRQDVRYAAQAATPSGPSSTSRESNRQWRRTGSSSRRHHAEDQLPGRIPWPAVASSERMLTVHATLRRQRRKYSRLHARSLHRCPSGHRPSILPIQTIRDSATPRRIKA
jgi:hypothetical protein